MLINSVCHSLVKKTESETGLAKRKLIEGSVRRKRMQEISSLGTIRATENLHLLLLTKQQTLPLSFQSVSTFMQDKSQACFCSNHRTTT